MLPPAQGRGWAEVSGTCWSAEWLGCVDDPPPPPQVNGVQNLVPLHNLPCPGCGHGENHLHCPEGQQTPTERALCAEDPRSPRGNRGSRRQGWLPGAGHEGFARAWVREKYRGRRPRGRGPNAAREAGKDGARSTFHTDAPSPEASARPPRSFRAPPATEGPHIWGRWDSPHRPAASPAHYLGLLGARRPVFRSRPRPRLKQGRSSRCPAGPARPRSGFFLYIYAQAPKRRPNESHTIRGGLFFHFSLRAQTSHQ
ncbi:uncharacterized protein LOC132002714 [Mustela nigripes]|uniref:uncharacterized protein LOC132002714 n=1 Tax=Mustela nigripes TaxID=77151 RepID=UPI002814EBBB|nr:uncharacterized protein LOC132002714 [Mustela nigripes]